MRTVCLWRHSGRHDDRRSERRGYLAGGSVECCVDRRLACRLGNRVGDDAAGRGFCRTADTTPGASNYRHATYRLRRLASSFKGKRRRRDIGPLWLLYREHSVPQFAFFAVFGLHDFLPKSFRMSVDKASARVAAV